MEIGIDFNYLMSIRLQPTTTPAMPVENFSNGIGSGVYQTFPLWQSSPAKLVRNAGTGGIPRIVVESSEPRGWPSVVRWDQPCGS
jgi:hypothetical protein